MTQYRRRQRSSRPPSVPEFSLVQISMAERRVLETWLQMGVHSVMRYEWALGTNISDIRGCGGAPRSVFIFHTLPSFTEHLNERQNHLKGYDVDPLKRSVGVDGYQKY
ncbi:hypothetical protein AVEN_175594-1 [Araneus ventricosus]|uniref:Uncharacterized protein n=1 Tax=Araneus ventricosus TaxID=182803 RepID=A0A4Y2G678_ARAVE|nr:hypothetical protein AVEN_175594-1 [Araneus ventricosus]